MGAGYGAALYIERELSIKHDMEFNYLQCPYLKLGRWHSLLGPLYRT